MSIVDRLLDSAGELARLDDEDASERYWQVVTELHLKPDQVVFDRCLAWCASSHAVERRLGADVLGQLGYTERAYPYRAASIPVLKSLLSDEKADVVQAALIALGHLGAGECVPEIAALAQHPDPAVRHGVAVALLRHESAIAFHALIQLSRDDDAHVRDWSTFGLGSQIDTDTPEIREALLARAEDADPDTRAEALAGLVKRGDPRVLSPLRRALEGETVGSLEVKAARELGSTELLASLEKLRSWWDIDPPLLESAIERCAKGGVP